MVQVSWEIGSSSMRGKCGPIALGYLRDSNARFDRGIPKVLHFVSGQS